MMIAHLPMMSLNRSALAKVSSDKLSNNITFFFDKAIAHAIGNCHSLFCRYRLIRAVIIAPLTKPTFTK